MNVDEPSTLNMRMLLRVMGRGARKKCPRCGVGNMYAQWNVLAYSCSSCGYEIERRGADTWFFTYMSTAFLTGLIILFMLLYSFSNHLLGHIVIVVGWFVLIVLTLPYRKAMAISIDYIVEKYSEGAEGDGNK